MKAIHLKNILSMLKKSVPNIRIRCLSNQNIEIVIKTVELFYHFEILTTNSLIPSKVYNLDIQDLNRTFKHIKTSSILMFYEENIEAGTASGNRNQLSIHITLNTIIQIVKLPFTYDTVDNLEYSFIPTAYTKLLLSDFCRMLKTLKNTSNNYMIEVYNNTLTLNNIETDIPIMYMLHIENNIGRMTKKINNNTLLRLNKLPCDNTTINFGLDFISSEIENEIRYYIIFEPENSA
jgi:hypothetical protein